MSMTIFNMNPREFLTELWGDPPPGPVLIRILPQNPSCRYQEFESLNEDLAGYPDQDIYTGVGLPAPDTASMDSEQQDATADISGIAGMWADLDVTQKPHENLNLRPTQEQAIQLLNRLAFTPTIIIHSGLGLQALWLFKKPWVFKGPEERGLARTVSAWWHRGVHQLCSAEGWTIDPVHAITKVLRVPGTYNNQDPNEQFEVKSIATRGPRYEPADFTDRIPAEFGRQTHVDHETVVEQVAAYGFVLSEHAEPPATKFARLIDKDRRFWLTWQKMRTDLPDQSPSGYDTALASIAMGAGWADQEIVALLIAWRRERGHVQPLREGYFARILQSAKTPIERVTAHEKLTEALEACPDNHGVLRTCLNEIYGIEILRLVKYQGDPPVFWMQTDKGDITVGDVHNLVDQSAFRSVVAAATRILISKCPERYWHPRAQALLSICEDVDVGDASHPDTETRGWIEYYLTDRHIIDDVSQAAITRHPVHYVGHVHIQATDFREWVMRHAGQNLTIHQISVKLKRVGATGVTVPVTHNGNKSSRYYWRLPNGVGPTVDESQ